MQSLFILLSVYINMNHMLFSNRKLLHIVNLLMHNCCTCADVNDRLIALTFYLFIAVHITDKKASITKHENNSIHMMNGNGMGQLHICFCCTSNIVCMRSDAMFYRMRECH